jgi:aspartate racemase
LKTLGIIGGIAPESTVEYYRLIISSYRTKAADGNYPSIILNSINLRRMLELVSAGASQELVRFLSAEIRKLAAAGADIALLASNTSHIVFDELESSSPIPLVSIVRSSCQAAKALGLKTVGLIGTRFTMQGKFYPEVFAKEGILVIAPAEKDQAYTHDKYMNELVNAKFLPETRLGLLAVVERMQQQKQIEGVILGGTELPLLLRDAGNLGIPFLDTTTIHVEAIVGKMLE